MKKKYTFFLILISGLIFAQDKINEMRVVGTGSYLKSELIDRNIIDANGEVCAGLMIQSDLTGLNYDSNNGVIKVNNSAGEDIIFLSANERVVKVLKSGYKPLQIILSDFSVDLKSGQMWKLEVTGDKLELLIPVSISTNIADPNIIIDGEFKGKGRIHQLSSGEHSLKIEKEGYSTIEETITVSNDKVDFNYSLEQIEDVPVEIHSTPESAKIFIGGVERGITPKQVFLYPGNYEVRLSKSGYFDKQAKLEIVSSLNVQNFNYTLQKNSGNIQFDITPRDAILLIDREVKSFSSEIDLGAGTHKIEVKKDGYKSFKEVISVKQGEQISKTYNLVQITGTLQVTVNPTDATVYLMKDGIQINSWIGMKKIREIGVGNYILGAKKDGYQDEVINITISENGITKEELQLEKAEVIIQNYQTNYSNYSYAEESSMSLNFGILYDTNIETMGIGGNLGFFIDDFEFIGEYSYGVLPLAMEVGYSSFEIAPTSITASINYYYSYGFYISAGYGIYSGEPDIGTVDEANGWRFGLGLKLPEDDMVFMEATYHLVENTWEYLGTTEKLDLFGFKVTFGYNFTL